jgi:hypothetical protein
VIGLLIVLASVASLARSTRRTFERSWGLPGASGFAAGRDCLLGVLVLLGLVWAVRNLGELVDGVSRWSALVLGAQLLVAVGCWALAVHLFLSRRVPIAALLPGSLYAAVAQAVAATAAGIYLPRLIATDIARYGAIGFSFAMLAWMIIWAAVLVSVAVVGAELGRDRYRPAQVPQAPDPDRGAS